MEEDEQPLLQEEWQFDGRRHSSQESELTYWKRKTQEIDRERPHVFNDAKDVSRHPSYTNFKIPYHILCRDRYVQARKMYEEQFQHEISTMLIQHASAYEVARFQRHMAISTLWPPLHNRTEIETVQRYFFRLSKKQQKRLKFLRNTTIT